MIHVDEMALTYQVRHIAEKNSLLQLFRPQYRSHPVLQGVSLEIKSKGITALLGRNGSGKTTLIKVLCGLLVPTKGKVSILGYTPHHRHPNLLRQVGVILGQKRSLWPELSLKENLRLTQAVYSIRATDYAEWCSHLIETFEMDTLSSRPIKSYSLGESMKAEIVNVLSFRPRLIFLDEPTIGLDVKAQRNVRTAVRTLADELDCHVVLTSHNLRDIVSLADQLYVLQDKMLSPFNLNRHQHSTIQEEELEALLS